MNATNLNPLIHGRWLGPVLSMSRLLRLASVCALLLAAAVHAVEARSPEYGAVQGKLARGWNSWDVHSVTTQVLLPEGFALRVGLKHHSALNSDGFLSDILIGRQGKDDEQVVPGPHTWNGSYTELRLTWRKLELLLQTAHDGDDLVLLATPMASPASPSLVVSAGVLWNRPGSVEWTGDHLEFAGPARRIPVYWTGRQEPPGAVPVASPFFAAPFVEPIGVSTGRPRSVEEIRAILARERPAKSDIAAAIETVLGWDTIFDPTQARVISPVSRVWSVGWGGYVLFEWDTFFAASLAAIGDRDLAYANALEALRESTADGFVPNYARPGGWKSFDRSEPPVGAITLLDLYRRFGEAWVLRDAFPQLLAWNRWWDQRRERDGYLVWGSDPHAMQADPDDPSIGTLQGAKYESGLDNSPMYDDAPFDAKTGQMLVADVGLTSLYVADCDALAEIAAVLGRPSDEQELKNRAERYRTRLQALWDGKTGIFMNRNLVTGRFISRLSPTNFYPLLARAATARQADRMVREHLLNPDEFWGDWVIPSVARSDPAFRDQEYWRGRIWAPMNYLVYLGLLNYDQPEARSQLAAKSLALFNQEWERQGHVHENYNAITGLGDDVSSSDRFYHWGALLGLVRLREAGAPASPPADTR